MTEQQMEKIISYCDKQLSKEELWDWVCDWLTDDLYWDGDGSVAPPDEQIEEVRIIFDKVVK